MRTSKTIYKICKALLFIHLFIVLKLDSFLFVQLSYRRCFRPRCSNVMLVAKQFIFIHTYTLYAVRSTHPTSMEISNFVCFLIWLCFIQEMNSVRTCDIENKSASVIIEDKIQRKRNNKI